MEKEKCPICENEMKEEDTYTVDDKSTAAFVLKAEPGECHYCSACETRVVHKELVQRYLKQRQIKRNQMAQDYFNSLNSLDKKHMFVTRSKAAKILGVRKRRIILKYLMYCVPHVIVTNITLSNDKKKKQVYFLKPAVVAFRTRDVFNMHKLNLS